KKLRWHTKLGEIALLEPRYRLEKSVRPFLRSAKVIPRGCSRALQRAIIDFAADQPFAQVRTKLQEHYGFEMGESTIQRIALGHAKNILSEPGDPGFS
ncbi:MAG: ISKra4 family transposase, partial [Roseiarcus sp.]